MPISHNEMVQEKGNNETHSWKLKKKGRLIVKETMNIVIFQTKAIYKTNYEAF
jgi:hypothetical protein